MSTGTLPNDGAATGLQRVDLLLIEVGTRPVAVSVAAVLEILTEAEVTPLPDAPPHVEGVAVFRESTVPLIDLRRKLSTEVPEASQILVVRDSPDQPASLAARVDGVEEIKSVQLDSILPPPDQAGGAERFILGILDLGGPPLLLLDLPLVLTSQERLDLDRLIQQALDRPEPASRPRPAKAGSKNKKKARPRSESSGEEPIQS